MSNGWGEGPFGGFGARIHLLGGGLSAVAKEMAVFLPLFGGCPSSLKTFLFLLFLIPWPKALDPSRLGPFPLQEDFPFAHPPTAPSFLLPSATFLPLLLFSIHSAPPAQSPIPLLQFLSFQQPKSQPTHPSSAPTVVGSAPAPPTFAHIPLSHSFTFSSLPLPKATFSSRRAFSLPIFHPPFSSFMSVASWRAAHSP